MSCDLCGKKGSTRKTRIEGVTYDACESCSSLGVDASPMVVKKKTFSGMRDTQEQVVENYSTLLRTYRENKSFTPKQLAMRLGVKESILLRWESGSQVPTLQEAKKIESSLRIPLVVKQENAPPGEYTTVESTSSQGFTIGDLLRKK